MNNKFSYRFAEWVVNHRLIVIFLVIALAFTAAMGVKRLKNSGDYQVFFKNDNPQLLNLLNMQKTYSKSDNILFVIAPKDGKVFTGETLAAVEELTEAAWKLPLSSRIDSITNYQNSTSVEDDLNVASLVRNPKSLSDAELEKIKAIAIHDPLLVNRLITEKANVTGINVTIQLPKEGKIEATANLVDKTRALRDAFVAKHPEIDVHLTGVVMLNSAFMKATKEDMRKLAPIMMGVIVLVLYFTLRSGVAVGLILLSISLSIGAAMGLAGWANVIMSAPVATAPITIMIMAIADGVHVLSHYGHNMREGMDRKTAMIKGLSSVLPAMTMTNVLSAIGYLTMNFSEVPPFIVMGNVVAVGIMIGFTISIFLVPALAVSIPTKFKPQEEGNITIMDRYQKVFLAHRNKFLIGSVIAAVALGFNIPKNEFNDSFHEYFDTTTEFRQATDFTMKNLTGIYLVEYSLEGGGSGNIYDPKFLAKMDEFISWFRTQPEVLNVNSILDVIKRLNKNMHSDDPSYYQIPESRELAAQYFLMYELSLPYGLDLTSQVNLDKSATRITITLKGLKSSQMLDLEKRAQAWLDEHTKDGIMVSKGAAGAGLMFAHVGVDNAKSMLMGNVWQILIISGLIILAVRSFKIGSVGIIPNMAPIIMAYGVWGATVGEINMAMSMVASISMGIVVDDTIHFLNQYLFARRELKYEPEEAVGYAFNFAGIPMWISTFTLVAGFLVLTSSHFAMNSDLGLLTAITIGFAALTEAFMLPGLLLLIDRKGSKV